MPQQDSLYGLLKAVSEHSPTKAAILGVDREPLIYSALIRQVETIVECLNRVGIERGDRVAMVIQNGPEAAVCCFAVSCGAISAPLNPAHSSSEFEFYLRDLAPKILIVDSYTAPQVATVARSMGVRVLKLEPLADEPAGIFRLECEMTTKEAISPQFSRPDDVALSLYTTGSTSRPKLVSLTHANLCSSARNNRDSLLLTAEDRCLNVMPLFHIHGLVFAVLSSLSVGSSVVCTPGFHALKFFEWLQVFRPTWYTAAPTMHQAILRRVAENRELISRVHLRFVRSGASGLPSIVMRELEEVFAAPVIEAYAMTESGLIAINRLPPGKRKAGSVGLPIGCQLSVMDAQGHPLPPERIGDIAIRGGSGYENNPEANLKSFVDGWFYTGDQGRLDSEGYVFLTGRTNEIINRGGEKISPWEIDEVLMQHPAVQQAIAFPVPDQSLGEEIMAGVVLRKDATAYNLEQLEAELQDFVAERLAAFKVPRRIVFIPDIPKGSIGKPERRAMRSTLVLPNSLQPQSSRDSSLTAPPTQSEERLIRVWKSVLKLEHVGVHDDFFQLGGDSIFGAQIISRIREEFGVTVPMFRLFRTPTIRGLAGWLDGELKLIVPGSKLAKAVPRPRRLPLSYAQQRLWFIDKLEGTSTEYNLSEAWLLRGTLDQEALERGLQTIVERHECLRTHFAEIEGEPVQVIAPILTVEIPLEDLCGLEEAVQQERVRDAVRRERHEPFDLGRSPLLRMKLLKLGKQDHVLLRTVHHIVSDGWSQSIFNLEFAALYEAYHESRGNPLKPLSVQYADFTLWQRQCLHEPALSEGLEYWKKQLSRIPDRLELPADHVRYSPQMPGAEAIQVSLPGAAEGLKSLSRQHQATLYMTLLAVFAVLLGRYSGQEDIVVGTPISNRQEPPLEELIGLFVNALVMRVRLKETAKFQELLEEVRDTALQAYRYQDIPFETLVEALAPARSLNNSPIFQVMFVLQNAPDVPLGLKGMTVEAFAEEGLQIRYDLEVDAYERENGIELRWLYNRNLFERWRMEQMLSHYRRALAAIVADPEQTIGHIELLTQEERHQILDEWNPTSQEYPAEKLLHELFEEQAEKMPEGVAAEDATSKWSYRELNLWSNRMAHYLRSKGIGPEALVGVCMERSPQMIVALLGILKAGGAYVPLDPAYPGERLRWMTEAAGISVVLSQRETMYQLLPYSGSLMCVDQELSMLHMSSAHNPSRQSTPHNLAYVMYTSGSSGRPKAVMIEHSSVATYAQTARQMYELRSTDRCLQFASLSFDTSVEEIFPCLIAGATLVLRSEDMLGSIKTFQEECARLAISVLNLPTAYWHEMVSEWEKHPELEFPREVRLTIIGGERAQADKLKIWRQCRSSSAVLKNTYGPTEATVVATMADLTATVVEKQRAVTIGRPIANARVYVLDQNRQPVPKGASGWLYIGGAGLARGYLGQPELTAERFVPDPFSGRAGERLYETGDQATWNHGGDLGYLGRVDQQVKIRGFRIECGEVETVLRQCAGVRDAVVVVNINREDKRLVAYLVAEPESRLQEADLRSALRQSLPEYMVPSFIRLLPQLPLSPNGKVDRKALAQRTIQDPASSKFGYVKPRNSIEYLLAGMWAELLHLELVGIRDNFFSLGGHSLMIMQITSKIREVLRIDVPARILFIHPTIETLSNALIALESTPGQFEKMAHLFMMIQQMNIDEVVNWLTKSPAKPTLRATQPRED